MYYGPHRKFTRGEDAAEYLKELDMIQTPKVICSLDLLEKLLDGRCSEPGCILPLTVSTTTVGVTAVISWQCAKGHKGKFCSSHKIRGLYANNVQVASAILISGNNYNKISQLFNFSSSTFMDHTTFYRYQRKLFFPVIKEWWIWMRRSIINELSEQPVVLAGDGQCDSPGKTAKYLSYYLMNITTNYIVHGEYLDKHMVGGKSAAMEVEALKRSLNDLIQLLNVIEVVTDASSSVIKEMRKCL